jgi:hypothetical protein
LASMSGSPANGSFFVVVGWLLIVDVVAVGQLLTIDVVAVGRLLIVDVVAVGRPLTVGHDIWHQSTGQTIGTCPLDIFVLFCLLLVFVSVLFE